MDEDVKRVVQQWTPPPPSSDVDARMLAAFRARLPWWHRWLKARVVVPVPVLAASILLLLAAGVWLATATRSDPQPTIRWQPVEQPVLRVIPASGGAQ